MMIICLPEFVNYTTKIKTDCDTLGKTTFSTGNSAIEACNDDQNCVGVRKRYNMLKNYSKCKKILRRHGYSGATSYVKGTEHD